VAVSGVILADAVVFYTIPSRTNCQATKLARALGSI
jgi:hypothetical protein